MKEQVITPRAGRSASGARSGAIVQRPARRERGSGSNTQSRNARLGFRKALAYVPVIAKVSLAILTGIVIFAGYRAAASASFFQVRNVDVSGASTPRVSADEVKQVVKRTVAPVGVWRADLAAVSRELERLPWVRRAVVSRVLPDGLRVRIVEREPRAVVRTAAGKLVWVDDDGVALGVMQPNDSMPPFFIRGWDEDENGAARAGNSERIAKYLEMLREWDSAKITERVSEVNLIDLSDVRVQLAGDDSQIEVRVGGEKFGVRLLKALQQLDESRAAPVGPFITYIDVSLWMKSGDKVVLGTNPNAPNFNAGSASDASDDVEIAKENRGNRSALKEKDEDKKKTEASARSRTSSERKKDEEKKKDRDKRERAADDAAKQGRPRRVS